jgi:uncharacterized protein
MKKIIFLLMIMVSASSFNAQAQNKENEKHRIVMQLTSKDTLAHKSLLKQLNNLKDGWGDDVDIVVVCHGPGIDFMRTAMTPYRNEIYRTKERGIRFIVCENSLKERKVAKEEILPDMDYVKMGIGEIVIRQEQGWSYIKAGF